MSRNEIVFSLRGVTKAFAGLKVVTDVSFDVRAGERLALIGPNGAGKTTVFNLISGAYRIDEGSIILGGVDIAVVPASKRCAMGIARSFQNIRLMPHLSVVENVMIGQHARCRGILALLTPLWMTHARQEAEAQLAEFGIETYPNQVIATLPYGIRKKVEIVRALMSRPKVLLLDEPAAGLNTDETAELMDFLKRVADAGVTLLVVEHDMSLVRSLCDHTVVLNFGRKIFDGPTHAVQEDPAVLEAYLGRPAETAARPSVETADHAS